MYTHTHRTHIHTCTRAHIHARSNAQMCIHTERTCARARAHTHTHTHTRTHTHTHVKEQELCRHQRVEPCAALSLAFPELCVYVCVRVCVCVCARVCARSCPCLDTHRDAAQRRRLLGLGQGTNFLVLYLEAKIQKGQTDCYRRPVWGVQCLVQPGFRV